MSPGVTGATLGLMLAVGVLLVASAVLRNRRPRLEDRMAPYLRDVPYEGLLARGGQMSVLPTSVWWSVFGPSVRGLARGVERVLGGGSSVRRRLGRLGVSTTLEQFRVEQVMWGCAGFVGAALALLLWSLTSPVAPVPGLVVCAAAFVAGVLARDSRLSHAVRAREQLMTEEFPTLADLMALAVAAGEGPVTALERVVGTGHGELSSELRRVLAEIRTGTSVTQAFDRLAARTGLPGVARFAEGLAIAIDRGTPLVDVLHAQAADARESSRRSLIETGARKEVVMMIPVVFLILPVTIVFAFFPGAIALHLTTP